MGAPEWKYQAKGPQPEGKSRGFHVREYSLRPFCPATHLSNRGKARRHLPSEPGVVRVGTRSAVTGLEDRIAQLDDFLSAARVEGVQPATLADVEEQRALLIKSLVQVRYAETLVSELR